MPEAIVEQWQLFEDKDKVSKNKALVQCCADLGLNLITSQPLVQGMATNIPLSRIAVPEVYNLSARHLQIMRSIPSKSVLSTVVGMKEQDHVRQNLEVIKKPLLTKDEWMAGIKPVKRSEFIEDALDF
jgi:aryl-alcohol dehydrogenase-like predicted oxidoreductase